MFLTGLHIVQTEFGYNLYGYFFPSTLPRLLLKGLSLENVAKKMRKRLEYADAEDLSFFEGISILNDNSEPVHYPTLEEFLTDYGE